MIDPQSNNRFSLPERPDPEGDIGRAHTMRQDGKAALSIFLVLSVALVLNYAFGWGLFGGWPGAFLVASLGPFALCSAVSSWGGRVVASSRGQRNPVPGGSTPAEETAKSYSKTTSLLFWAGVLLLLAFTGTALAG